MKAAKDIIVRLWQGRVHQIYQVGEVGSFWYGAIDEEMSKINVIVVGIDLVQPVHKVIRWKGFEFGLVFLSMPVAIA